MKNLKRLFISIIIMSMILSVSVFGADSYIYDEENKNLSTRCIDFVVSGGSVSATTDVKAAKKDITCNLVLVKYENNVVSAVAIDKKSFTLGNGSTFKATLPYTVGAIYKAYLWDVASLKPYTNIATYPSNAVLIDNFKFNDVLYDLSSNSYDLTLNGNLAMNFTAKAKDNGTKITVRKPESYPGTIDVFITSSDSTVTKNVKFNITIEQPLSFYEWLDSMGIDRNVDITTYVIE